MLLLLLFVCVCVFGWLELGGRLVWYMCAENRKKVCSEAQTIYENFQIERRALAEDVENISRT